MRLDESAARPRRSPLQERSKSNLPVLPVYRKQFPSTRPIIPFPEKRSPALNHQNSGYPTHASGQAKANFVTSLLPHARSVCRFVPPSFVRARTPPSLARPGQKDTSHTATALPFYPPSPALRPASPRAPTTARRPSSASLTPRPPSSHPRSAPKSYTATPSSHPASSSAGRTLRTCYLPAHTAVA